LHSKVSWSLFQEAFLIGLQPRSGRTKTTRKEPEMTLSARISKASTTPAGYAAVTLLFLATLALGYAWAGGLDFVQGWGGGIAAGIATWYLIWKTQRYWAGS
jgi:hypothetical protein